MRFPIVKGITYNTVGLNYIKKNCRVKLDDIDGIERYVNGELNDKERKIVESLFIDGETNIYLRDRINKDWDLMLQNTELKDVNTKHILGRIHRVIHEEETNKKNKPLRKILQVYMRVAAILMIPLLLAGSLIYYYVYDKYLKNTGEEVITTIFAPYGSRVSFNLPDGTIGMLNSGSSLTYRLPFSHNRNVKMEGEGWFEVNRDENHPFEISAGNSKIKVLGTSFNVSAYPAENYVEVVLLQGEVEFLDTVGKEKETILPSERLVFRNGNISKSVTDPSKYSSWTEGKLIFRGDGMAEVARRIERWYNVKVKLADSELEKYSFHATFEDDKLDDLLRLLSMTSPIKYKIAPSKILTDGTYEKEVVTIFLRN
jgi:transmembrane sensor